jgi:rhomboid protease GluP
LLGLTLFVFVLQMATFIMMGVDYPAALGMKVNDLIVQGQLWRLLTPLFLHSTRSILHIAFNMYALHIFGNGLERHFGSLRFLALYLLSGFCGNVFSFLFSEAPSLGSSTAIFGLMGAQGAFLYQNRELFGKRAQRALIHIITIASVNLFIGLSPGIDNWGHIGGLVGGSLFAWFGGPLLRLEGVYPLLNLADRRETGDMLRTGLLIGALFAGLAAMKIFL